jgi:hypothetical protein
MSIKAQIEPFVNYDWTIEKIENFDGTTIIADTNDNGEYDVLNINFSEIVNIYYFYFDACQGSLNFNDSNQSFEILYFGCAVTSNPTNIAAHFLYTFILEEGGETATEDGPVYGPFSYDFSYTDDLVYLHITNLEGSVATFYATNLGQDEFLKKSISIYPNPFTDVLRIESSSVALDKIKIYDLRGRLVEKYDGVNNQIDLSHLQRGLFILEIETAVGILKKKLVKK